MQEQAEKLRKQINSYNSAENLAQDSGTLKDNDPRLMEAAFELAERSKSVLGGLYFDFRKPDTSFTRRVRNRIIDKITRVVRSTMERPLLTQQKFNEQTYYILKVLYAENQELKKQIKQLKK